MTVNRTSVSKKESVASVSLVSDLPIYASGWEVRLTAARRFSSVNGKNSCGRARCNNATGHFEVDILVPRLCNVLSSQA